MPVIKSAKKKLRQDKQRGQKNNLVRRTMKEQIKAFRKAPNNQVLAKTMQIIDKAAKQHILHKNKAARLKSSLSKILVHITNKKPAKA